MNVRYSSAGVPQRIRDLERFGVGDFGPAQRDVRCAIVQEIMRRRGPVPARPRFSVVVPAHKEERYLLATLRSLAEQANRDVEFLIVSNGEPRGNLTQRIAEQSGFTVLYERMPGVGRARQCGLLAARGEIIVTTDADTLHDPRWLDAIEDEWRSRSGMVAGYGWIYALSPSPFYQICSQIQNVSRAVQGRTLLFGAAEANSWFLRDAAMLAGGYDVHCQYAEGVLLMKQLLKHGEIHCASAKHAAVFTSDRRILSERIVAGTQYLLSSDPTDVRYGVVR